MPQSTDEQGRLGRLVGLPKKRNPVALAVVLLLGLACGDNVTEPEPPPASVATRVEITPASLSFSAFGDTIRLSATVFDQNSQRMQATVAWSTSAPGVVTVDSDGLVTALANGTATITATASSVRASAAAEVRQVAARVEITPASLSFSALGDTVRLSATVFDQNGQRMRATVVWSTSEPGVMTVDGDGLVTAVANGTATVTATASSVRASAAAEVKQEASAVEVAPLDGEVVQGDTVRLMARVTDNGGRDVPGESVSWSSVTPSVAAVNSTGLVTGIAPGEAEITATAGDLAGSTTVTVIAPMPTAVVVMPDTVALAALEDTVRLSVDVRDQIGRTMEDEAVVWSSSDAEVVRVDSIGLVTAVANGTATVTARAGEASGSAMVLVAQEAATMTVEPATATIAPGDTLQLVATAFDAGGAEVMVEFAWSTSDLAVAGVNGQGLVTAAADGNVTITASTGEVSGRAEVTVVNSDRGALVALYEATDGPNWKDNENWLSDRPLGEWYGVDVDTWGRVRELWFTYNQLTGEIPPELGNLAKLEILSLGTNQLTGEIPSELGNLANLRQLRLSWNLLVGNIPPELGNLAKLGTLWLGDNQLTGEIPPELVQLSGLETLSLGDNQLTGEIPPELGNLANLNSLDLQRSQLTGEIPPELGNLAKLETLSLGDNQLTGEIPPELGNLATLGFLSLQHNQLTGEIPPELGNLANLGWLSLGDNQLTGRIPQELSRLSSLRRLFFDGNPGLCAPGTPLIVDWLDELESARGPFCNEADAEVLAMLFEIWDGGNWIKSDGWLESNALERWHGVEADSSGHVISLDLRRNRLMGRVSPSLTFGRLSQMTVLRLDDNNLVGKLPGSLTGLELTELSYTGTEICVPTDQAFQEWLGSITVHRGTLSGCELLSDREALERFYRATGGANWTRNEGWLTDRPLDRWYGIEANDMGQVTRIDIANNNLTGQIPFELGQLSSLEWLNLGRNRLTGSISPELGQLSSLKNLTLEQNQFTGSIPPELGQLSTLSRVLDLRFNELTGDIPPELGNLANLAGLRLNNNQLTGEIPPELVQLSGLKNLSLNDNQLTGEIPPELGQISGLQRLLLSGNQLTGSIPPELGQLSSLADLWLDDNQLVGSIPQELGSLNSLITLRLFRNNGLAGALPLSLTKLSNLQRLQAYGTMLCAPADEAFRAWLDGVLYRWVPDCALADFYLTQAVQSLVFPVPLVAGEPALLRVFVTAPYETSETIPSVRARFFRSGAEVHVAEIPRGTQPIPLGLYEGDLGLSANVEIPGEAIQEGLEVVIEVDPDGVVDPALGVKRRIPEAGRTAVEVSAMPHFDLTLIPFVQTGDSDSTIVETVRTMAEGPEEHRLLAGTRNLLPVGDMSVTAHEPVLISSNSAYDVLRQVSAIYSMEDGRGYYMGMMTSFSDLGGVAYSSAWESASVPSSDLIAHELGHNMSLGHAPCGDPTGVDPSYPYEDGDIGLWGFDWETEELVSPYHSDLMSYCWPKWISDYHFGETLRYRLREEGAAQPFAGSSPARTLLVWGGVDADGVPYLDPAFVVDASAAVPPPGNTYTLTARTLDGEIAFSYTFDMPEVVDGEEGRSSFVFTIPVEGGWATDLASVTLSGPGGTAVLDGETDDPMVILREGESGQVRGFLRGEEAVAALAPGQVAAYGLRQDTQALFTRGLPRN